MWGKGSSSSGIYQRIAVYLISGFVLLQLAVFVRDAVWYRPQSESVVEYVHDTVYITEKVYVRSAGDSPVPVTSPVREIAKPQLPSAISPAPVRGDYGWKWDVVELNSADSAALDELPGIGGYYARQILRLRERLGAFTEVNQLLEIRGMDSARVARLSPRVRIDSSAIPWIDLRTVPEETLARHPYVGKMAARGIVRLRETVPPEEFSLETIVNNGVLTEDAAARFGRYLEK